MSKRIKFKPEILNAILKCFKLLDTSDQQWLVDRLCEEWMKNRARLTSKKRFRVRS